MNTKERKLVLNRCLQLNWKKTKVFNPVLWNATTNSTQDQMPVPFSCQGAAEYFYSKLEQKNMSYITFMSMWRTGTHVFQMEEIKRLFMTQKIDVNKSNPKTGEPVNTKIALPSESISYSTKSIDVVDASLIVCTYSKLSPGEYHENAKKLLLKMSNFGSGSFQSFPSDAIQF
jgi:hypothetical protein